MSEVIRLDQVSLYRRTQEEFSYDLKRTVISFIEGKYRKPSRKLILNDINITINQGEKIGIIGSNGSGKSTLLKVICGILPPSMGTLRVKGEIAPLIELGAGFDPDLSVRDNIILYGVMLGFSRQEMLERVGTILEFAELENLEDMPVKSLSSGMSARLGFAIATDIEPEILILDEVLSVGDESFKHKCQVRMDRLWGQHTTILVVSHSLDFIATACETTIWLDRGNLRFMGDTEEAIALYLEEVKRHDALTIHC